MLKQQLREQLKQSMLAKDTDTTSVIRLILSALTYYEIQKGGAGYEATDEDVLTVVQKEVKQRNDSIEQFQKANRQDLVDKEEKELKFLEKYLPQQMSEKEVTEIVKQTVQEVGANSLQDIGKVMGALMPKVKGKADGNLVSIIVKKELNVKS